MKILDEIDNLSKISIDGHDEDGILSFMYEFASRATDFLAIERINIWLLNNEKKAIFSIAEYDKRDNAFSHHSWIHESDVPNYFKHLKEDKIILAPNIHTHEATFEFSTNYAKQHDVISLMDIPLRLNGSLMGVICFEKTGKAPRIFNEMEQTFAVSLAHLTVAYIENIKRKKIQQQLQQALKEKELIFKELNHRVKNNFSVLVSLLRVGKENSYQKSDDFFETFEYQIFSMLKVHELLLESENYSKINLNEYLLKLSNEFASSYPELKAQLKFNIADEKFDISPQTSVHIGLILTEIFLNALKYSVIPNSGIFQLNFKVNSDDTAEVVAGDSGTNFDFYSITNSNANSSHGLSIIKDLAEGTDLQIIYPQYGNSQYKILIKK